METELSAVLGVAVEVTDGCVSAVLEDTSIAEAERFAQSMLEAIQRRGMRQCGPMQVCGVGEGVLVAIPVQAVPAAIES